MEEAFSSGFIQGSGHILDLQVGAGMTSLE